MYTKRNDKADNKHIRELIIQNNFHVTFKLQRHINKKLKWIHRNLASKSSSISSFRFVCATQNSSRYGIVNKKNYI